MAFKLIEKGISMRSENLYIVIRDNNIFFSPYLDLRSMNFNWCIFWEDVENEQLKIQFSQHIGDNNSFGLFHPSHVPTPTTNYVPELDNSYCMKPKNLSIPCGAYMLDHAESYRGDFPSIYVFKKVKKKEVVL